MKKLFQVPTINVPTTSADDQQQQCSTSFGDLAQSMLKMGMFVNESTNPIDILKKLSAASGSNSSSTTTPLDLSGTTTTNAQLNVHTSGNCNGGGPPTDGSNGSMSMSGSPSCGMQSDDDDVCGRLSSISQYDDGGGASPTNASSARGSTSGGSTMRYHQGSKRFRTHLSPMQVQVMKSLFNDYKTPSMSECDTLGHVIGLHKRVVQVCYRNRHDVYLSIGLVSKCARQRTKVESE